MGWDASDWTPAPDGVLTVHHPLGDVKKLARSYAPLAKSSYLGPTPTHYLARWSEGGTESGSSGAALVDAGG